MRPQEIPGLGRGREHALRGDIFPLVEDAVEDFLPQVGHAHLVQIRKGQGATQAHTARSLADRAFFNADVMAGVGEQGEEFFHLTAWPSSGLYPVVRPFVAFAPGRKNAKSLFTTRRARPEKALRGKNVT